MLRERFSGIASMSADDKALRNAMVHMQKDPEVLRFSVIVKRIAMERARTGKDTFSQLYASKNRPHLHTTAFPTIVSPVDPKAGESFFA